MPSAPGLPLENAAGLAGISQRSGVSLSTFRRPFMLRGKLVRGPEPLASSHPSFDFWNQATSPVVYAGNQTPARVCTPRSCWQQDVLHNAWLAPSCAATLEMARTGPHTDFVIEFQGEVRTPCPQKGSSTNLGACYLATCAPELRLAVRSK